jgi:hypothetical protein
MFARGNGGDAAREVSDETRDAEIPSAARQVAAVCLIEKNPDGVWMKNRKFDNLDT